MAQQTNNKNLCGGFSYYVSDEQIERFKQLPIEERLRWLEEAQEFIWSTVSKETWNLLQKFRRGEL